VADAACRCGWDGQGAHPCHGKGYTCKAPAKPRLYALRPAAVAGVQMKLEASHTFACDACWGWFETLLKGEG